MNRERQGSGRDGPLWAFFGVFCRGLNNHDDSEPEGWRGVEVCFQPRKAMAPGVKHHIFGVDGGGFVVNPHFSFPLMVGHRSVAGEVTESVNHERLGFAEKGFVKVAGHFALQEAK